VDKPYHPSYPSSTVKNASQEEEANVGVMWFEDWPGLQLLFSITTTQKQQHYWMLDKWKLCLSKNSISASSREQQ